ncbi:MAG: hypothetical protein ABSG25_03795 [Bryobacteraceae bacterium]
MIKEFLKYANLNGLVESFIVNKDKIKCKVTDGSIAVFIESKKYVFKNDFALTEVQSLVKVLDNFDSEFEEDDTKLIFKNKKKSKLTWLKADMRVVQTYEKTKEEIKTIYSSDKVELNLNKEEIESLSKLLKSGIDNKIKFYSEDKELKVSVGQEFRYNYESNIKDGISKAINNTYVVDSLIRVLDLINGECKITLDAITKDGTLTPLPLIIELDNAEVNVTYFIAPMKTGN